MIYRNRRSPNTQYPIPNTQYPRMDLPDREYPRLRFVEAIPEPQSQCVILRDPTQMAAGMLVVGWPEFALISLLDGQRCRTEIQVEYARRCGQLVRLPQLDAL